MTKKRLIRFAIVAAAALVALLGALYGLGCLRQFVVSVLGPRPRPPFKIIPHEHLEFAVSSWLGDSGTIKVDVSPLLALDDGRKAYRITYSFATSDKISAVYLLKGQASVLVDALTLAPYEYEEQIISGFGVTGGHAKHTKLVYDQTNHEIHYYKERDKDEKGVKDGKIELRLRSTRKIPPNAQHFTSLLYLVRDLAIQPGGRIEALISDAKHDLAVQASAAGEKDYEAPSGEKRKALVLKTASDFGKPEIKESDFSIWLDKAERFPVRLDAATKWGTISARLVKRTIIKDPATESK